MKSPKQAPPKAPSPPVPEPVPGSRSEALEAELAALEAILPADAETPPPHEAKANRPSPISDGRS